MGRWKKRGLSGEERTKDKHRGKKGASKGRKKRGKRRRMYEEASRDGRKGHQNEGKRED